jgi:hypothetical protein
MIFFCAQLCIQHPAHLCTTPSSLAHTHVRSPHDASDASCVIPGLSPTDSLTLLPRHGTHSQPLTAACCIRARSHATPCNGPSLTHSLARSLIFFLPRDHYQAADGASSAEMGGGGPAVLAPSSSNDDPSQSESRVDGAQLPAKKQRLPSKVHAPQSRSPHTPTLTVAHAHLASLTPQL